MALGEVPLNSHEHGAMPEELEDFGGDMSGPVDVFGQPSTKSPSGMFDRPSKRQQLLLANGI